MNFLTFIRVSHKRVLSIVYLLGVLYFGTFLFWNTVYIHTHDAYPTGHFLFGVMLAKTNLYQKRAKRRRRLHIFFKSANHDILQGFFTEIYNKKKIIIANNNILLLVIPC